MKALKFSDKFKGDCRLEWRPANASNFITGNDVEKTNDRKSARLTAGGDREDDKLFMIADEREEEEEWEGEEEEEEEEEEGVGGYSEEEEREEDADYGKDLVESDEPSEESFGNGAED